MKQRMRKVLVNFLLLLLVILFNWIVSKVEGTRRPTNTKRLQKATQIGIGVQLGNKQMPWTTTEANPFVRILNANNKTTSRVDETSESGYILSGYSLPANISQKERLGYLGKSKEKLNVGLIVPYSNFHRRFYVRAISEVVSALNKEANKTYKELFNQYKFALEDVKLAMLTVSPSPTDILSTICKDFVEKNVSAILYLTNAELYGKSTAASQYLLQLAGYLRLPVIAWNADNSGLFMRSGQAGMILQLAPSVKHQADAMLSVLIRYNWHQFALVTSQIAGHDEFVRAIRERVQSKNTHFKFKILETLMITKEEDLIPLVGSEVRVLLLYSSKEEATSIFRTASRLGLTGESYIWIVTQSVIGDSLDAAHGFPVGMLGVHFNTSHDALKSEIATSIRVFASGVESLIKAYPQMKLNPHLVCEGGPEEISTWHEGAQLFKHLKNVTLGLDSIRPPIQFTNGGMIKNRELQIMNLRPGGKDNQPLQWEQIGSWQSWKKFAHQLDIKDIVWPGYSHKPPDGVPEKFHIKIGFLEEAPYISMADPEPETGKCAQDRSVLCRVAPEIEINGLEFSEAIKNASMYQCCSGMCIDLLVKFAEDIGFTYELSRSPDGQWGTQYRGKWNGLIAELMNKKVEVTLASLMINSQREAVVDFSVPFMDSGIAVLASKRTGIVSNTAFLEPFDGAIWMLVGLGGIQAYSFFIFLFEWLSPLGFDMKMKAKPESQFSLFRSVWLVWVRIFQASVHIDAPKGVTAKLLAHVWSSFSLILIATYTANLAVFMITREESHKFEGINDSRLSNPQSMKPAMRFGTVKHSHTHSLLRTHYPEMASHMELYNVETVAQGVQEVSQKKLDAFIYEGPVVQYEAYQDISDTCSLVVEGTWHAQTGYAMAFPRNSKHIKIFNQFLMEYNDNGDLERLKRYYFTGPCSAERGHHRSTDSLLQGAGPLSIEQFYSVFTLLFLGILFSSACLAFEGVYANYIFNYRQTAAPKWMSLLSKNMTQPFCETESKGNAWLNNPFIFPSTGLTLRIKAHNCNHPNCIAVYIAAKEVYTKSQKRVMELEIRMRLALSTYLYYCWEGPDAFMRDENPCKTYRFRPQRSPINQNQLSLLHSLQNEGRRRYYGDEITEFVTVL